MKYEHIGAIMCVSIILYSVALLTGDAWGPLLAGICLPVIICGCVYYRYKKLYEKLERIEKLLQDKDKADEDSDLQNKSSK